jgi:hypothetical protein
MDKQHKFTETTSNIFCSGLVLLFLSGCTTTKLAQPVDKSFNMVNNPGKAVVVGKINMELEGPFVKPIPAVHCCLLSYVDKQESGCVDFSRDMTFCWVLDSGNYVIKQIRPRLGLAGLLGADLMGKPINLRFHVEPGDVVYLGRIDYIGKYSWPRYRGSSPMPYQADVKILDEFELTMKQLEEQYPNLAPLFKKRLLSR